MTDKFSVVSRVVATEYDVVAEGRTTPIRSFFNDPQGAAELAEYLNAVSDKTAPPPPASLQLIDDLFLSWHYDINSDVAGFEVYKDGALFESGPMPQSSVMIAGEGTYTVRLYDDADPPNFSGFSTFVVNFPEPVPEPEELPARSVYLEPGAVDDRFNLVIGSNVEFTDYQHFNPTVDFATGYSLERDVVLFDPTAPLIPVYKHVRADTTGPSENGVSWRFAASYSRLDPAQPLEVICYIRCPVAFEYKEISDYGEVKGNGCAVALAQDGRTMVHLYQFAKRAGATFATAAKVDEWPGAQYNANGKYVDRYTHYGSHGGPFMRAPTIRYHEATFEQPVYHALGIILPSRFMYHPENVTQEQLSARNGEEIWSYIQGMHRIGPGLKGDSLSSYTGQDFYIRSGTLFALPNDISAQMRTTPGKNLAKTLYLYGVYEIDAGAGQPGFSWSFEPAGYARDRFTQKWGYSPRRVKTLDGGVPRVFNPANNGENSDNWVLDLDAMFRALRVVKNPRKGEFNSGTPRGLRKGPIIETF